MGTRSSGGNGFPFEQVQSLEELKQMAARFRDYVLQVLRDAGQQV